MVDEYYPAREVVVAAERAGQRLDNFLFQQFKFLPKTRIYKMLRKGEVRINGGRAKQTYRIQPGDRVRLPPVRREGASSATRSEVPVALQQRIAQQILYEDARLMVIDKPPGIAVHAGSGVSAGVIEALRALRPNADFIELIHRLDRPTSGCLLVALERALLLEVQALLREGGIQKTYLALLAGRWKGGGRRIEQALSRRGAKGQVRQTHGDPEGKHAVSRFTPIRRYADATLMQVRIDTGRTHQIRVHAAEQGQPVLGDTRYGDFALNRQFSKRGLKRLFLHAQQLDFSLPSSGQRYQFEAPLPEDLQAVLQQLSETGDDTAAS